MVFDEKNKNLLSLAEDRISFLYVEKAKIQQTEYSVEIVQGTQHIEIPITTILCLVLGPGVSITHRAVENIAKAGCSICWVGENICSFYCYGEPVARKSVNILTQVKCHENSSTHMDIIRKMYEMRYPGQKLKSKKLAELRGVEGSNVRSCYEQMSEKYDVKWDGRVCEFDNIDSDDAVNMYLTSLNQYLYAVTEAVINVMGFSTALGFIHTGNMRSFVYDVADLYKEELIIPAAFKLASAVKRYDRKVAVSEFRTIVEDTKLTKRIVKDIKSLFSKYSNLESLKDVDGGLWDFKMIVSSGINYSK